MVAFLLEYATVDNTLAKISIMLLTPSNVNKPKTVNIIENIIVEAVVLFSFATCFVKITFLITPTMLRNAPLKAPNKKYCEINNPSLMLLKKQNVFM